MNNDELIVKEIINCEKRLLIDILDADCRFTSHKLCLLDNKSMSDPAKKRPPMIK